MCPSVIGVGCRDCLPKICGICKHTEQVVLCLRFLLHGGSYSPPQTRLFKELRGLLYNDRLSELGLWSLEEHSNRANLVEFNHHW